MSLDTKFKNFQTKHDLPDEALAELLSIFNDSFIELAHKLLNQSNTEFKQPEKVKVISNKKFATKIAVDYAEENGVTLDDFNKEKITKKDIDDFIKSRSGSSSEKKQSNKKTVKEKITEKCSGIDKNGNACSKEATTKPENAKNCYCFRHALDWKNYELSSDSDLEEETFLDPIARKKCEIVNDSD
jgi:hypothetical protein